MTFKTNVPDRWIENPDQLPFQAFNKGMDIVDDEKKSATMVSKHGQSASLGHSNIRTLKTHDNFRS